MALGVQCSGIAYLLYFGLVRDVGPTSALTVTFLNPLLGILWGTLFLDEVVGWHTLVGAAAMILGTMLEERADNPIPTICKNLLAVKGIGPWTVDYALLRGYGYADCSLPGDVAIRAALQRLLGEDSKPDMARTEQILQQWQPHRTIAAAHLWASLADRPNESA